jgi:DNA helicase-2/ATP-dependent DNA helicase PcrA
MAEKIQMETKKLEMLLLDKLTDGQKDAVMAKTRRLLVVAGAGSGKTEVMARRIAWWVGVEGVSKDQIVAFTFTERAAEEMKFRIRSWIEKITPVGEEVTLGQMYVGTIHGFCLLKIREFWPDEYHNFDILDESARASLILRGFNGMLGLNLLKEGLRKGQFATLEAFIQAYDQLHEHNQFDIELPSTSAPHELGAVESDWCKKARLKTNTGTSSAAVAFATSAARYYAYLKCRRFLDFSTSQSEFLRRLSGDKMFRRALEEKHIHLVVDEVQDINPVQSELIVTLTGKEGKLTMVGDHRQSIYGFRGAKVELIGEFWEDFKKSSDSKVVDLQENFRSTPRIISLANQWAETISPLKTMKTPAMLPGNKKRKDLHHSHVALIGFAERQAEAAWIAEAIRALVPSEAQGTIHDKKDGNTRGLAFSDIAILLRASTEVRVYMRALEAAGIPCVVRAGPDLFSQPEVLLLVAALAISARMHEFYGSEYNPKSLPQRIDGVLGCAPVPEKVLAAAAAMLRTSGLAFSREIEDRLLLAAQAIASRIETGTALPAKRAAAFKTPSLREFLTKSSDLRRVFPQKIFHMLLSEAEVEAWDTCAGRGQTALFHLGALSGLITGIETPGWTSPRDYPWQIIGLCQYGSEEARAEEQPLMVQPDAVTISTIHGVKGLEFPGVFLGAVNPSSFPSSMARRKVDLPLDGSIVNEIDVIGLSDNEHHDGERRLMYVALTRAERFLFISHCGKRTSSFIKELRPMVSASGGTVTDDSKKLLNELKYAPKENLRDVRLATSFSDLRYYLKCPHDFYLRKVLGFSPTIDQAFGYGRGVHNLMRAIHTAPKKWAALVKDRPALERELQVLIDNGLFYLRYTTGNPADNMRGKGLEVVADYIERYAGELGELTFEPEKSFETLVEYGDGEGGVLVSGAIDLIRRDNPPQVTLVDFKSGDPESDKHQKLDEEEMRLQVALYGVAAKKELEYQPEQGLVRYLDADDPTKAELKVPLGSAALKAARDLVADTAMRIRKRKFDQGPASTDEHRCGHCDFLGFCGMKHARDERRASTSW